ncbi:Kinesin-like protein KIN-4C [Cucurbita argyrosperma subsp. argyrosperma]|nr:Kinesin-like protein KIN-4C [Cucurbita argyrosperma subsp. argyrosperma]
MRKATRQSKKTGEADVSSSSVTSATDSKYYEKRIRELESENEAFQKEIKDLKNRLENASPSAANSAKKLREGYIQKLDVLEDQVTELKKKLDVQSQLSTRWKKGDEVSKQTDLEIMSLKAQKVQLQCRMKLESVQFRLYKGSLEKEVLQLKREKRRNEHEMNKLLTSNQRLKMVLQRKTEEASEVTKRIRNLLESRRTSAQRRAGAKHGNITSTQYVENEFEVTARLHELCSQYEHLIEEKDKEIAKLQEEADALKQEKSGYPSQDTDDNMLENNQDMNELKEQMVMLSGLFNQMRIQKFNHTPKDASKDVSDQTSPSFGSNNLCEQFDSAGEEHQQDNVKKITLKEECCSCSKKSLCKTTKCQCRSTGRSCGTSCGCALGKCSNRYEKPGEMINGQPLKPLSDIKNVY